jgi:acetyl-CoA C-acetyltransferase
MDGLTDPFSKFAMGKCAEKTVSDFKFTRSAQDEFAIGSYQKTIGSIQSGKFKG